MPLGERWRIFIGSGFLLLQLSSVTWARFHSTSLPYWAPNDFLVEYDIRVAVGARQLTPAEIQSRYHIPASADYEYAAAALLAIVAQRERELGGKPARDVIVSYRLNGHAPVKWELRVP